MCVDDYFSGGTKSGWPLFSRHGLRVIDVALDWWNDDFRPGQDQPFAAGWNIMYIPRNYWVVP